MGPDQSRSAYVFKGFVAFEEMYGVFDEGFLVIIEGAVGFVFELKAFVFTEQFCINLLYDPVDAEYESFPFVDNSVGDVDQLVPVGIYDVDVSALAESCVSLFQQFFVSADGIEIAGVQLT